MLNFMVVNPIVKANPHELCVVVLDQRHLVLLIGIEGDLAHFIKDRGIAAKVPCHITIFGPLLQKMISGPGKGKAHRHDCDEHHVHRLSPAKLAALFESNQMAVAKVSS